MSILHVRHVVVGIIGLTILTVACSAPSPTTPKGSGDDEDQTATGEKKSSDSPKPSQVPTPAGPATTTNPTDPTNTNTNTNGDDPAAEQCWNTCIAANPTAQALSTQMDGCYEKCNDGDTACETTCDNQFDQLCSSAANEAACNAIDQCDAKCFPNEGGGAN